MSFHEVQFPPDISYGFLGGPEYSTDIVEVSSGHEQRNINWSEAKCSWDVAHKVKTMAQMTALIAFFRARMGRAYGFRFKDWMDYTGTGEYIDTGDGVDKTFQLIKHYISGGYDQIRTISKPVSGTVKIYFDAVEQVSGWTCNYASGLITFTDPPGDNVVITADYQFDVPVRFDIDKLRGQYVQHNQLQWESIPIVEIRVD
jgi:uncharacterized protein (TIGR02217 family)